jgi:hypothetical protein
MLHGLHFVALEEGSWPFYGRENVFPEHLRIDYAAFRVKKHSDFRHYARILYLSRRAVSGEKSITVKYPEAKQDRSPPDARVEAKQHNRLLRRVH